MPQGLEGPTADDPAARFSSFAMQAVPACVREQAGQGGQGRGRGMLLAWVAPSESGKAWYQQLVAA